MCYLDSLLFMCLLKVSKFKQTGALFNIAECSQHLTQQIITLLHLSY